MNIYSEEIKQGFITRFLIKYDENTNFSNAQLSNDDFKKISETKGFKVTNNGLGFCIDLSVEEPIFSKKKKEQFKEDKNTVKSYIDTLVKWLESKIIDTPPSFKCLVCGYDEFGEALVGGIHYNYIKDYKAEKELKFRYCKKCRTTQLIDD